MKYKYIGTEKQLLDYGFVKDEEGSKKYGTIWYEKDCLYDAEESDDVVVVALKTIKGDEKMKRILQFNYSDRPYETIKPYIQDLIDDGLVKEI